MKQINKLLVGIFFALVLTACNQSSDVAATLNGKPIYTEEVDQAFGGRVAEQIYNLRRNVLDNLIEQKLLEQAAAEKKLSVEDFLKQETGSKVPEATEEELKAIYEANRDRFDQPFEQVKATIADSLKRNRQGIQRNQIIAQLREKNKVEVKLKKPPVRRVEVSSDDDPCIGPANAKVTVIEFSDYQCPFCGRARPTVYQMIETYKNDLKYCFRDFPLSFHQDAFLAHVAAQCAFEQGVEKFWDYNKKLFENQRTLKPDNLKQYAKEIGLNTDQFNPCLESQKFAAEVQKDIEDGVKAGVTGTPGFFVNGIMVSGAQPFSKFKEMIDDELKK